MAIFNFVNENDESLLEQDLQNPNELLESYIYDEVSKLSEKKIKEFVESDNAKDLLEAGVLTKPTLIRLSKTDDLDRRTTMAAFHLAKQHNDTLWKQLVANRVKERQLISKIKAKYGNKAVTVAKIGQKSYMKGKLDVGYFRK